jgi:hypothetical protein
MPMRWDGCVRVVHRGERESVKTGLVTVGRRTFGHRRGIHSFMSSFSCAAVTQPESLGETPLPRQRRSYLAASKPSPKRARRGAVPARWILSTMRLTHCSLSTPV